MSKARIIIAGGGTGGHIFPAVAVAKAIKTLQPDADILFVGAKGKMEMEKVPQAGFNIEGLDIAGFNRTHLWKNWSLPFKLIQSFWQVRSIFKRFQPTAAFGVGGYSSFPVLKLAQQKGIPTFLHESNAFAGKANQMLGKNASKVFVAGAGMEKFFPASKLMITGNPVRKEIAAPQKDAAAARQQFGLQPNVPVLLIIGGSLGARSINQAIEHNLPALLQSGWQVIWQTGKLFEAEAKAAVANNPQVWTSAFIEDMSAAYAAADIVVSRAGAMSVAELCIVAKPAVFVPFPFAAEDHQTANAMQLVNAGAAAMVADADAKQTLVPTVLELMHKEHTRQHMQQQLKQLARLDADTIIAKEILNTIHAIA